MGGSGSGRRSRGPRTALVGLAVVALSVTVACGSGGETAVPTGDAPTTSTSSPTATGAPSPGGTSGSTTPTSRAPRTPGSTAALPSEQVPNAELEATVEATDQTWLANPAEFRGQPSARVSYECSPDGDPSTVWGDDVYTDDSSVCTAAVHAGLITVAEGGRVVIEIRDGLDAYEGSTANGVTSLEYASWPGSFVFPGR